MSIKNCNYSIYRTTNDVLILEVLINIFVYQM